MGIAKLSIFSALSEKMRWHQERQGVLTENVANAETAGYQAKDLKDFSFGDHMNSFSSAQLATTKTNSGHFSTGSQGQKSFGTKSSANYTTTPEGNGVNLEDEMMKVASNQMDYQMATTLYTRSVRILRTAIGRG